jgi:uncharacterized membrane protein YgcG
LAFRAPAPATEKIQSPNEQLTLPLAINNRLVDDSDSSSSSISCPSSSDTVPATRLDALPLELVDLIFAEIGALGHFFAIGYALPRMWSIALRHADALYAKRAHGRWAGARLVAVSHMLDPDGVPADAYPPGLLSQGDIDDMCKGLTPEEFSMYGIIPYDSDEDSEMSLCGLARYNYDSALAIPPRHNCCSGGVVPRNKSMGSKGSSGGSGGGSYCGGVGLTICAAGWSAACCIPATDSGGSCSGRILMPGVARCWFLMRAMASCTPVLKRRPPQHATCSSRRTTRGCYEI